MTLVTYLGTVGVMTAQDYWVIVLCGAWAAFTLGVIPLLRKGIWRA